MVERDRLIFMVKRKAYNVKSPSEKLADALEALEKLQAQGRVAIRASDLSRTHKERLTKNGFLREVIKGWHVPTRPDELPGESTAWYASFWGFCQDYLNERFGSDWCISPEQSLSLLAGSKTVPVQLLIRSPKGTNNITALPHNTGLLDVKAAVPLAKDRQVVEGLNVYSLPAALIACSPNYFVNHPTDARAALATIQDASELLGQLLEGGHSVIAGRLAGAFRNIGRERIAEAILSTMRAAGFDKIAEVDPFERPAPILLSRREASPYVTRLKLMWQEMRGPILEVFPAPQNMPNDIDAYLDRVQEIYVTDAYHSLSIEGYRVSRDLIERVRSGAWNPGNNDADREHRDAMAARGYWQAYQAVRESLRKILGGENAGDVADHDHGAWYRELFGPSVTAGILQPADLAGYRNDQVFIRRSMHVPPNREAIRDAMPAFFSLLKHEPEPAVRVVLGHFILVYIHPYMDGNGRIGRFMMNAMLASGGYPWTVIPVETRTRYLESLETASVGNDIRPFAAFLGELVAQTQAGRPAAQPPK